jgi:L-ectoine synthase
VIVRRLNDDVLGTEREVKAPSGTWTSRRLSLKDDNMGFSINDTLIHAGTETYIWYKHHLEAVYCVEGKGEIEDLETGITHPIEDGTLYLLNKHERHWLRATETMRMVCVFSPPLTGREVHTKEGFYPLITDEDDTQE